MSIQQQLQKTAFNEQNKQLEQAKILVEKLEADDNVVDCEEWGQLKVLLGLKDLPPPPKTATPEPEQESTASDDPDTDSKESDHAKKAKKKKTKK